MTKQRAPSEVGVIVLFGASGDLARKLVLPALYRLEERDALGQRVVGIALEDWTDEQFQQHCLASAEEAIGDLDSGVRDRFLSRLSYVGGDYTTSSTFERLARRVGGEHCIHYLAVPPSMFELVVSGLSESGLVEGSRIVVEKPFGHDLPSARHLNRVLHRMMSEQAIYRIDHYLGKEPVENLLAFRCANSLIDAVWNRHYVDHVQITMAESFGVADRGPLYETLGVVRDVIQNHLLQVICLLAMDAPVAPTPDAYADERSRLLKAIRTVEPSDVVYGQYSGYRNVAGVSPQSTVPTFAALELAIDTPRWYGVPFYIRAGKSMATTATEAVVVFKDTPPLPFSTSRSAPEPNRLVFRIGPSDGVDLLVQTKVPGEDLHLATTSLSVDYDRVFGRIPTAYERLLLDALEGDHTNFAREDGVEEAWRVVSRIVDPPTKPPTYRAGGWGPKASLTLLNEGRSWHQPRLGEKADRPA